MKGTLILKNPIIINGKLVNALTHDAEEITAIHFTEAENRKMRASASKGGNLAGALELDYGSHLYLGFAAIVCINHDIDYSDLERLKGQDVREVMRIGRNFIMKGSEEPSEDSSSEEPSEATPEPLTFLPTISPEND